MIAAVGAFRLDSRLEASGPRAEGHLIRKRILRATNGDSDFTVDYWFTLPDGRRISAHRGIPKALWLTLREGEMVMIVYAATDPKRNFPLGAGVTSLGITVFVSIVAAGLGTFGALLTASSIRALRSSR